MLPAGGQAPLPAGASGHTPAAPGQTAAPTITSAFPDPPHTFVDLYTDEHVAGGLCPEPPEPLAGGSYAMFGVAMTCEDRIIRSLGEQGIRRLYHRNYDHKKELKKMNHSVLVNFLDLLDVLVKCPDTARREEKCQNISMLFIQMHHLINELRPHQARETIRISLLLQRRTRIATADRVNQHIGSVTESICDRLNAIPADLLQTKQRIEQDVQRLRELCLVREQPEVAADDTTDDLVQLDFIMCNMVLCDV